MKKVKTVLIETANILFTVEIYEKPSGSYKAEYSGATPKFVQIQRQGEPPPKPQQLVDGGVLRGDDIDKLIGRVRSEIVTRYGKIVRER